MNNIDKGKNLSQRCEVRIWDVSTRVFHWALVAGIFSCWLSMEQRWLTVHKLSGYFILFLLIYRVIWGFVGAKTARFSHFAKRPKTALRYLLHSLHRHDDFHPGHNPAGGWMVLCFLLIISAQVISGLFANDDVGFSGPLADWVLKESSDLSTQVHGLLFNILLVLIWLHVVAVFFYVFVKGQALVRAMITGKKPPTQAGEVADLFFVSAYRLVVVLLIALSLPVYLYLTY